MIEKLHVFKGGDEKCLYDSDERHVAEAYTKADADDIIEAVDFYLTHAPPTNGMPSRGGTCAANIKVQEWCLHKPSGVLVKKLVPGHTFGCSVWLQYIDGRIEEVEATHMSYHTLAAETEIEEDDDECTVGDLSVGEMFEGEYTRLAWEVVYKHRSFGVLCRDEHGDHDTLGKLTPCRRLTKEEK